MTSPVTILLLPRDPKLLADGPGGSRAPMAWRMRRGPWVFSHHPGGLPGYTQIEATRALLLVHEGQVVEQARGWLPDTEIGGRVWRRAVLAVRVTDSVRAIHIAMLKVLAEDLGKIIILDENGREEAT